jgi:hypothetical protein
VQAPLGGFSPVSRLGALHMRVGFLTKEFTKTTGSTLIPGGCAYYRALLPQTVCEYESAFGLPAWTSDRGFGVRQTKTKAVFGFNVVVLKLIMDRWVPYQIEVAKKLGQKIIVDIDDHYDGLHEDNLAHKLTDPSVNKVSNREHYKKIIELADCVTVTTPFLYEYYKDRVPRVEMVRNAINPDQFLGRRKHSSSGRLLGWAGGMQWRSNDAETAAPWLGELLEEHDLMFHHAGHMPNAPSFSEAAGIPEDRMLLSPMKPLNEYAQMLDFDIGLVLLSDIPFNQAKSALKGMEYAAAGIPFVAYATEEYKWLAEQGVGRVASTPEEWKRNIEELLDYKTRKREAAIGHQIIMKTQTIQNRAAEWNSIFASLGN